MSEPQIPTDYDSQPHSPAEERVNRITHGIGIVLSLVGSIVLISRVVAQGDPWHIAGCSIFAAALVAVYTASTLSHSFSNPQLRRLFRVLDQGCIYLLIVATYTPFVFAYLRTPWWWTYLAVMWSVAVMGFLSKILFAHRVEAVSIWIYLILGWMPTISASSLTDPVTSTGLYGMLVGGLFYTVGCVFLLLDSKVAYFHAVWHLFVIAGSTCHFFVILLYVAPVR